MDRNKFIQSSANIRVLEKKLLSKVYLERLIEATDLSEALKFLGDTVYQEYIVKLNKAENYEEVLKKEQVRSFKEVYSISPDRRIVDLLAYKYYYHNMKVLVKEDILEEDFHDLYIELGDFNETEFKESLSKIQKEDSPLKEAMKFAKENFENTKNPQEIDLIIDKMYFEKLIELADSLDVEFFKKYLEDLIDFTNITILLRSKSQNRDIKFLDKLLISGGSISKKEYEKYFNGDISHDSSLFSNTRIAKSVGIGIEDYNKTGSLSIFEKEEDNYFIKSLKDVKRITYGPEVIFAYLYAKEMEIKNLRIILISKLNKLDSSFIRERLRETYV